MLFPKKQKFTKQFKGNLKSKTLRGSKLVFGTYALKSLNLALLTSKQIESGRRAIVRKMKRLGFLWVRVFPDKPITQKPNEVRMGKGKGAVKFWVSKIRKGQIIYEVSGMSQKNAKIAFDAGTNKLPVTTQMVVRGAYSLTG